MRVVVTGASGHLGANLVRRLLEGGDRVRAVVHRRARALEGLDVEVVPGDVLDPESLRAAFTGVEVVYHLAGVISIRGDAGGQVSAVNVEGAANAAAAAREAGVRRMVHCSSVHAFDTAAGRGSLDETAPRVLAGSRRHFAYDRSKAEGERRVRAEIARGLDAVIVHPTAVIGPFDFEPSLLGRFFLRLYRGSLPALVRGGFDFVDARDAAEGMVAAAARGGKGESYLLGGHFCRIAALASLAAAASGRRHCRPTLPLWLARVGVPFLRAAAAVARTEPLYTAESLAILRAGRPVDHSKAERDLGYSSRPIEETVADLYRWFDSQGMLSKTASLASPGEAAG
ncbi:MAG: NAD-dependent epimerase/dehydratase family protein [Actinobacteria bacterium]|nr:NAD-dependent epimerase/dehydratase family protein [Actinomycetota bacterium]